MQCAYCSTPVPDDATYCHKCGSLVSDAEGQAAATASIDASSMLHMEQLLKDETSGEFEIQRLLGKGGMAMVYLAREVHLDRKVAIKVLPPELTFGHGVERFKREAKTAAALDHPHIIPIYRIASGGKLFWYAMKYLEGRSLEQHLKEEPRLSLEQVLKILQPVAEALEYAHEHRVVHRDIKPANVMLDSRNRVTVTDFGIAKALTEGTLTASGSVIGTPFYMSPEQGMGRLVTGASDQYSVAVMAYRMLSGQVPFEGDSAIDILHKHCTVPPPPLDVLRPDLPNYVYAAVNKALAKQPEQRFSRVTAFVQGLKEQSAEISGEMVTVGVDSDPSIQDRISTEVIALPDTGPGAAGAKQPEAKQPAPAKPEPKKKRRRRWLIPLMLLVVMGGGTAAWWFLIQQGWLASWQQSRAEIPSASTPQVTAPIPDSTTEPISQPATAAESTQTTIAAPPQPTTGNVTVTNLPPNGVVNVDGVRQDSVSFELEPGAHTISMSASGYRSVETEVEVAAGGALTVPFTGAQIVNGTVRITGLPSNGTVRVDGRRQSGTRFQLRAGRYTVQLTAPGYTTTETQIRVAAGGAVTVPFTGQPVPAAPPPAPGIVRVSVNVVADIFIDAEQFSSVRRIVDTIPAGPHTIRFRAEGFAPKDTVINLAPGETVTVRTTLQERNPR
jgi:serine/threonine protein kinase